MNCWDQSVRRFFFGFGSGGLSGGRCESKSDWKVIGGVVAILLIMEELLSLEATEDRSILMLLTAIVL